MTPEVSKQIAELLGQVTVSELAPSPITSMTDEYLLYESVGTAYRLGAYDLCSYLCKHVFTFLFQDREDHVLRINPQDYIEQGDTPVTLARRLIDMVPSWIGDAKPEPNGDNTPGKNLSEIWFKHFQYYYFDNLNNRLPTMLLKYGEVAAEKQDVFDILIWIDTSPSMAPEVATLRDSVQALCEVIYRYSWANRIKIIQNERSGYYDNDSDMQLHSGAANPVGWDWADTRTSKDSWHQKGHTHVLDWCDNLDGLGSQRVKTYFMEDIRRRERQHHLHPEYPAMDQWMDENLWYTTRMVQTANWHPNHKRLFIAISDESCDCYVSVTGQLKVPYVRGHAPIWNNGSNHWEIPNNVPLEVVTPFEQYRQEWEVYKQSPGQCPPPNPPHLTRIQDEPQYIKSTLWPLFENAEWGPYVVPNAPGRLGGAAGGDRARDIDGDGIDSYAEIIIGTSPDGETSDNDLANTLRVRLQQRGLTYETPSWADTLRKQIWFNLKKIVKYDDVYYLNADTGEPNLNVWYSWGFPYLSGYPEGAAWHVMGQGWVTWNETYKARIDQERTPGHIIDHTDHWQFNLGGFDGNINCNYQVPWGATGGLTEGFGYDPVKHNIDTWAKGFNDNNVKFFFLETETDNRNPGWYVPTYNNMRTGNVNDYKDYQYVPNSLKWINAYTYLIEKEMLSKVHAGGAVHITTPDAVAETLTYLFEGEIKPPPLEHENLWSNSMWESHLDEKTVQILPTITTQSGKVKRLYLPRTAVIPNENGGSPEDPEDFIWKRYDRRNYIRIVGMDTDDYSTSGWDKTNDHDWTWTDEKTGTALEPSRTDEDVIPEIDQKMGDIDQTLKVLDEFLDDFADSLRIKRHKGKVIFTASTEPAPLEDSWVNVVGSAGSTAQNAFVWSGSAVDGAGNTIQLLNTPQHHHNTVGVDVAHAIVRNVSMVGRPEGEDVGGIAKVPTAERIPGDNVGRQEDTRQHLPANLTRSISVSGAYSGSVRYTGKLSTGADRNSPEAVNNMPLYYIMRAFRYNGSDES